MRNDAFAQLGDTNLSDLTPQGELADVHGDEHRKRTVPRPDRAPGQRHVDVPCYLFPNCGVPGGTMQLDSNGDPIQNGVWPANFDCIIPDSVTTRPAGAGRPSLYGHGLFGTAGEVASSPQRRAGPGTRDRLLRDR